MTERVSESELLAYVEGELDAMQVQQIRERLAGEEHVLAALERLREDRKLLRTAGEPVPPIDFLTELEPQLARPMLMEAPPPGAYRRRHRRRRRMARLTRLGLAAAVLMMVSGAVWMAISVAGPRMRGEAADRLRAQDDQASTAVDEQALAAGDSAAASEPPAGADAWPPSGTAILHERPLPPGPGFDLAMSGGDESPADDLPSPFGGDGAGADVTLVSADFALIVPAEDLASGERLLEEALTSLAADAPAPHEAPVALVRNFTEAEARGLIARYFDPVPGEANVPERYAEAGNDSERTFFEDPVRRRRWVDRMLRELRARHQEEADEILLSARLLGPDALAASYERQLSFSGRGATHTITIPASSLPAMLTRLYELRGAATRLRALPTEKQAMRLRAEARRERDGDAGSLRQWAADHRRIREFLSHLRAQQEGEACVLLPVVLQTPVEETPARR
ncbi:MAG: hypothetical protein SYC29_10455 [Planctomycetota bacterium]|nr:hypothetical protein [Planctomycetota bacterium]